MAAARWEHDELRCLTIRPEAELFTEMLAGGARKRMEGGGDHRCGAVTDTLTLIYSLHIPAAAAATWSAGTVTWLCEEGGDSAWEAICCWGGRWVR